MQSVERASPTLADIVRNSTNDFVLKNSHPKTPIDEQSPGCIDVKTKITENDRKLAPLFASGPVLSMFDMMESLDNNQGSGRANDKYFESIIKEPQIIVLEANKARLISEQSNGEQILKQKNPEIVLEPIQIAFQDIAVENRADSSPFTGASNLQSEIKRQKKLSNKRRKTTFMKNLNARKAAERLSKTQAQSVVDSVSRVGSGSPVISDSRVNGTNDKQPDVELPVRRTTFTNLVAENRTRGLVVSVGNNRKTKSGKENESAGSTNEPEIIICEPSDDKFVRRSNCKRTLENDEHAELFILNMQLNASKRDNKDLKKMLVTQSESTAELHSQIAKLKAEVELWRTLFEDERLERMNDNRRAKRAAHDRVRHLNEQLENANNDITSLENIGRKLSCDFDDVNNILKDKRRWSSHVQAIDYVNDCRIDGEQFLEGDPKANKL